jgi:polygalacturonase
MLMKVLTSSGAAITYFTNSNSPPVQLNVGDTLTTTIKFSFIGVPAVGSSSQGFKLGIFDFADGSNVPLRVSSDSSFSSGGEGASVEGYSLFGKFYSTFADSTPIDIRTRTNITDSSLLGASADWKSLAKGGDTNAFGGFTSNNLYTIQILLYRSNLTTMAITEIWSNLVNGATLSASAVDTIATNFYFDGIEFRPANNTQAAATNSFREVKVEVTSAPVAPSILTDPQDQSVPSGQSPSFNAAVTGTLPLFYQWFRDTNTLVSSSSISFPPAHTPTAQPTVTITNVQPSDAGAYSVVVSNAYGSVTSAVANLSVTLAAPTITQQPQDLTVIPTQTATFSVAAVGSEPFTYQWYFNTITPLTDATNSAFTIPSPQPGDAGIYSVIVSNPVGTAISSNAVLTVNTNPVAPIFIVQPASLAVSLGDDASFTASAIGTQPITYQWATNGIPLPGATSTTLSLPSAQAINAGNYTVVASNSIGTTASTTAVLSVSVRMTPPLPVIPSTNFFVTDFGATTSTNNNATAFTNAINAAAAAGGGTVIVPAGTYLCGPIALSNNVNLLIDSGATLKMLPRLSWPSTLPPFIFGSGLHDVAITGTGTIDGNAGFGTFGAGNTNWWPFLDTEHRPDFIHFDNATTRILVQGVTLKNPPAFHLMLKGNNVSVTIQNITIDTDPNSPNTDGMDLASTNVLVQNCSISDGDDNIEIGGSGGPAADITVSNCTFGAGHGVSIGSKIQGGVHDLLVSNCTFVGGDYGIRMKSDRDIGGLVQNLKYLDIGMTNVGYPIVIYSYYDTIGTPSNIDPTNAAADSVHTVITTTPIWRNIIFSNVTATANTGNNIAGIVWGLPEMPASNITFKSVNLSSPGQTFEFYNTKAIRILDSQLTTDGSANSLTLFNADVTVSNSAANSSVVTLGGLTKPPTNNVLAFFSAQAGITDTNVLGLAPFLTLSKSTLVVSNHLSLGGATVLNFGLGSAATRIDLTGNLALAGLLNITDAGGFTNITYTLFTYGGSLSYGGLTIGTTPNTNFTYTISTNTAGQVRLIVGPQTPPPDPFVAWQQQYFGCTNCPEADGNADPLGKGMSNTNQFLAGINPTNSASALRIISAVRQGNDVVITWKTAGVRTNAVQASNGNANGAYSTNFTDLGAPIVIPVSGDASTNYIDFGGATNGPARYYRIRLVP